MTEKKRDDQRFRKAYRLFLEREQSRRVVTTEEICRHTGWKPATVTAYASKKWDRCLSRTSGGFRVNGIQFYTEDEFARLCSQKNALSRDPHKPELPDDVEQLVLKAREAAILAVDVYNRPGVMFRAEGFTVLMVIAWRSLFHAVFQKQGVSFFYQSEDGTPLIVDGEERAWELKRCVSEYFGKVDNATRNNLEFMIGLRNRIEHRFLPALDPHVAGECQAHLLNFEDFITEQFGSYYAIRETLALALQTSVLRSEEQALAIRRLQGRHYIEIMQYLQEFRSRLAPEIYDDPKFSFRVYLIAKLGNHENTSDAAMEFIKEDPENPGQLSDLNKRITFIREKQVAVLNPGKFKPSQVAGAVAKRTGVVFNMHYHTNAWQLYKARGSGRSADKCQTKYCQFDVVHKDYVYTQEWVDFLVKKVSNPEEYRKIKGFKRGR